METDADWIAPYYRTHVSGKWQISRARVSGVWRLALWARIGGEWRPRGVFDTFDEAKAKANDASRGDAVSENGALHAGDGHDADIRLAAD